VEVFAVVARAARKSHNQPPIRRSEEMVMGMEMGIEMDMEMGGLQVAGK